MSTISKQSIFLVITLAIHCLIWNQTYLDRIIYFVKIIVVCYFILNHNVILASFHEIDNPQTLPTVWHSIPGRQNLNIIPNEYKSIFHTSAILINTSNTPGSKNVGSISNPTSIQSHFIFCAHFPHFLCTLYHLSRWNVFLFVSLNYRSVCLENCNFDYLIWLHFYCYSSTIILEYV